MKPWIILLSWILHLSAGAQGTINFANDTASLSSPPDRLIRFGDRIDPGNVFQTNGAPAVGTNFQVQLYYGASTAQESSLIPLTSAPGRLRASTTSVPGVWSGGGVRTLSFFAPGDTVKIQLRVWDINFAPTFEQALANPAYVSSLGVSPSFLYTIPASGNPTLAELAMNNFTGMCIGTPESCIPEPESGLIFLCGLIVIGFAKTRGVKP
jgi:hypothetical protein